MQNLNKSPSYQTDVPQTTRNLSKYSTKGYRVLCMARRYLTEEQFKSFLEQYRKAEWENDHRKLVACIDSIESDLELLGATAIEDRLQYRVPEVITKLRAAGIVIWVLTGDKMETAINIANSCSLFNSSMNIIEISLDKVKSKVTLELAS